MTINDKNQGHQRESILARFNGEPPPRRQWIHDALMDQPERNIFSVEGHEVEILTWGDIGKPGLLLLHGASAQADWWSVIAPAFAQDFRVAAISWTGMGRSSWRSSYSISDWGQEVLAAIDFAQLNHQGKPIIAAHSLGGSVLLHIAAHHGDNLRGGIMVDSFIPRYGNGKRPDSPEHLKRYNTEQEALARYRFIPEQGTDYPEIVDYIARHSLRWAEAIDNKNLAGWTWRFDPNVIRTLDVSHVADLLPMVNTPIALIAGEQSSLLKNQDLKSMESAFNNCVFSHKVRDAKHHIMVDQPLALIEAIRNAIKVL